MAGEPVDDEHLDVAVLRFQWGEISCLAAPASARPFYRDRLAQPPRPRPRRPDRVAPTASPPTASAGDRLSSRPPQQATKRERLTEPAKHQ
jgi:hypothetical protein